MKQTNLKFSINQINKIIYSNESFIVKIKLENNSTNKLMINKRLSIGYENAISREVYFKITNPKTEQVVGKPLENYDRPPTFFDEYGNLNPKESIFKTFDLSDWYEIELPKGKHKLMITAYYQADEPQFVKRPDNVIKGIFQSEPLTFYWEQK